MAGDELRNPAVDFLAQGGVPVSGGGSAYARYLKKHDSPRNLGFVGESVLRANGTRMNAENEDFVVLFRVHLRSSVSQI